MAPVNPARRGHHATQSKQAKGLQYLKRLSSASECFFFLPGAWMDLSLAGRRPLSSLSTNGQDVEGQQQQQRAAQKLAALEKEVSEKVDKDFFVEEVLFR